MILGWGEVSEELARELLRRGERALFVVGDAVRARRMRGIGASVVVARARDMASRVPEGAEAALVVTGLDGLNLELVRRLRRGGRDIQILAEASGPEAAQRLRRAGANYVLEARRLAASTLLEELTELESQRAASRLVSVLRECERRGLAVFMHDDPDPDTIASALALKRICVSVGVRCRLYHGGRVSHPSNRLMVSVLRASLHRVRGPEEASEIQARHDKTALVEASLPGQNNVLPPGAEVDIVIDHHPLSPSRWPSGELVDIRPKLGAASTMMTGYLRRLWIRPDPPLASALLYAIKVDTADLTRNVDREDIEAISFLAEHADLRIVRELEAPPTPLRTADVVARAIEAREVVRGHVISFVGGVRDREALAQAAELLVGLEGVCAALVFGVMRGRVYMSARARHPSVDVGAILQRAFGARGSAGGHASSAGASVPLEALAPGARGAERLDRARRAVRELYLRAAGLDGG
ncbi:MAG: DHH family phosphoesterase [Thermoplasmatota archaeon]